MMNSLDKSRFYVSVGLIFNNKQLLITQRTSDRILAGYWEFPGGKIESEETPEQALIRELKEEINIDVVECLHLFTYHYDYPTRYVVLEIFNVLSYRGHPQSSENQAIAWVNQEQLLDYNLLAANREMLTRVYEIWPK